MTENGLNPIEYIRDQLSEGVNRLDAFGEVPRISVLMDLGMYEEFDISGTIYACVLELKDISWLERHWRKIDLYIKGSFSKLVVRNFPCNVYIEGVDIDWMGDTNKLVPGSTAKHVYIERANYPINFGIEQFTISNYQISLLHVASDLESLVISNTVVSQINIGGELTIHTHSRISSVNIKQSIIGCLYVDNIDIDSFTFSRFRKGIDLAKNRDLSVDRALIFPIENPNEINIQNSVIKTLSLDCSVRMSIYIFRCQLQGLKIVYAQVLQVLKIDQSSCKSTEIESSDVYSRLIKLQLFKVKDIHHLSIRGSCSYIYDNVGSNFPYFSSIQYLELSRIVLNKESRIEIEDISNIGILTIDGLINKGQVTFKQLEFMEKKRLKKLSIFEQLISYATGWMDPVNDSFASQLEIRSSRMNDTIFINCKMPNNLICRDSELVGMKLINSKYPTNVVSHDTHNSFTNEITTLQQIQKNLDSVGDKSTANKFRSMEMDMHLQKYLFSFKFAFDEIGEILSLSLNSISNRHGESWIRAIIVIFIYSLASYWLFLLSIGRDVSLTQEGLLLFKSQLKFLPDYAVPGFLGLSKSKLETLSEYLKVSKTDLTSGWTKVLIFLNDIVVMPYLIYQLVNAFRKHGGKG
jgi:hypothetical protein